jgi:hypothetical protein
VSPPYEIRYTGTQEDALDFAHRLAANEGGLLDDYNRDPLGVLEANGWEFEPRDAFPSDPVELSPDYLQSALTAFAEEEEERLWPLIWWFIPWIGVAAPGGGQGPQSA